MKRAKRSVVWETFEEPKNNAVVCTICQKKFAYTGGTTNLREHLKRFHPRVIGELTPDPIVYKPITEFLVSSPAASKTCSAATSTQITELLVDWISRDLRPLNILNDSGLQTLMEFIVPGYSIPSRTHVAKLVQRRHTEGKKQLKEVMKSAPWIGLTTDCWSSKATQSFVTITAHFIDDDWKLVSAVLTTSQFPGSHTGERIAQKLRQSIALFDVPEDKIAAIVQDEAANAVLAGSILHEECGWESCACAAHLLQTSIRHAIDSNRAVQNVLAACRRLVTHFKHSNQATEELLRIEAQMEIGQLKLVQDVATRWNSGFFMLERVLKLRLPITAVLSGAKKKDHRDLLLKDQQWALIEKVIEVLHPFQVATTVFSGQQYVTMSLVLPVVTSLREQMRGGGTKHSQQLNAFRSSLAKELTSKFSLDNVECSSCRVIASALDPRFRSLDFLSHIGISAADVKCHIKSLLLRICHNPDEEDMEDMHVPEKQLDECDESDDHDVGQRQSGLDLLLGKSSEPKSVSCDFEEEIAMFFSERPSPNDTDPLVWWRMNRDRYTSLSLLARKVLCVTATSVPSEQVFSACGVLVSKLRCALSPNTIDAIIFINKNFFLCACRQVYKATKEEWPTAVTSALEGEDEEDGEPELPDLSASV